MTRPWSAPELRAAILKAVDEAGGSLTVDSITARASEILGTPQTPATVFSELRDLMTDGHIANLTPPGAGQAFGELTVTRR